jgi:hypothetical protein
VGGPDQAAAAINDTDILRRQRVDGAIPFPIRHQPPGASPLNLKYFKQI